MKSTGVGHHCVRFITLFFSRFSVQMGLIHMFMVRAMGCLQLWHFTLNSIEQQQVQITKPKKKKKREQFS